MSTSRQQFLVLLILIVTHGITMNAQPAELFYSFDFVQSSDSNWTENNGSFNATVHTFNPVTWLTANADCPLTNDSCVQLKRDAFISRTIPTTGYHSIRLQIDVHAVGVEIVKGDWCIVQYRTETITWQNVNVVQGQNPKALDYNITIPDTSSYNNQDSFQVKVGIDGNAGPDNCYFDNLRMFGIPYTQNPSATPSKEPSFNPSATPSKEPSFNPPPSSTAPPTSRIPSALPSIYPTVTISATPSQFPSRYPSVQPTSHIPSVSPILSNTVIAVDPAKTSSAPITTRNLKEGEVAEEISIDMRWAMVAVIGVVVC
eukprot:1150257_1